MKYTPVSFRSDYSLMTSMLKIKDIIKYAKDNDSSYVGVLDLNPYGIMDFYDKCVIAGIKCIFGMIVKIGNTKLYLYIKDYDGYLSLIKIHEAREKKELTFDDIIKYNKGIICVLPCESYNLYDRLKTAFPVYFAYKNDNELKRAYHKSQKVLFLNEILYLKKSDSPFLKILYKIDNKNYEVDDNYILEGNDFDIKTINQFVDEFDLKFEFGKRYMPKFCKTIEESTKLLYSLSSKGLQKRLNGKVTREYQERLKYELEVIVKMGFVDYFLIVYDYVKYAKQNNIYVGPGRGSAAGSLVSYTLGITEIDPIKYDLLFERFLNPERVTMPDIDMDFEDVKRNSVIEFVRQKYGESHVSLIIAYGTLRCRQTVRDVGKVLEIDEGVISGLSKLLNAKKTLKENLDNAELVNYVKNNNLGKLYKISMRIEGLKNHTTIHAAGVVISSIPLTDIIPTFKSSEGMLTGYTMEYLEKLGLLKMDFLSVRNLTTLHRTLDIVKKKFPSFELKNIPLDDVKTYKLLSSGKTENIFQFETPGMKKFIMKLKPETFDDITAAIALFRPGPMDNIDEYIARRKGEHKITYLHEDLIPILKSTYGIIIYQEQIMQILVLMGGYSYAEADLIRRAMSKKKKEVMIDERSRFVERSVNKGYTEEVSEQVYDLIVKFANYGFNKSHSVSYALIGYQMAYLKANFVELFHLNTLNMNLGSDAKTKDVIEDAKNKGLKIIKPNISLSKEQYVIDGDSIILPLSSIKNITVVQGKTIVSNQPYSDYFDFFKKVYNKGINRASIETLIKAGALDIFGVSKNTLLNNIDSALTYIELISNLDESLIMKPDLEISEEEDKDYSEKDIFGFYISGHPASKYTEGITKIKDFTHFINKTITTVLLVDKLNVINTKKGEKMAFLNVSDDTGSINSVIFPKDNRLIDKLNLEKVNKLAGSIMKKNDDIQFVVKDVKTNSDIQ